MNNEQRLELLKIEILGEYKDLTEYGTWLIQAEHGYIQGTTPYFQAFVECSYKDAVDYAFMLDKFTTGRAQKIKPLSVVKVDMAQLIRTKLDKLKREREELSDRFDAITKDIKDAELDLICRET